MEETKDHISLVTAKLLKDCKIESKLHFAENEDWIVAKYKIDDSQDWKDGYFYPAYTWQEILWGYPKEFFGEEGLATDLYYCGRVWEAWDIGTMSEEDFQRSYEPAYIFHTTIIKDLLQQNEYKEADRYFRQNCILIKY